MGQWVYPMHERALRGICRKVIETLGWLLCNNNQNLPMHLICRIGASLHLDILKRNRYVHSAAATTYYYTPPRRSRPRFPIRLHSTHKTIMSNTESILKGKYPAKAHCAKVAAYLAEKTKQKGLSRIYLEGQKTRMIEDNDEPQPFRYAVLFS